MKLLAALSAAILLCLNTAAFAQSEKVTEKSGDAGTNEKISYVVGYDLFNKVQSNFEEVDVDAFFKGIQDAVEGSPEMSKKEMKQTMAMFKQKMQQKQMEKTKKVLEKNKAEGAAFMDENKGKEGVKTLDNGIQYIVIKEGTGKSPQKTDKVKCHYKGMTIDGEVFDSSYKRGEPAEFKLDQVIQGWTETIPKMKTGGKWKIFIPADLAYGNRGAGKVIEPGSTLIFEVELISIET
ncbi:MAG: FKBP-type peptidyl-prolyl cis-trans isomerase [Desulfarculaceae bacterium]|nr:FKBP-type peptidyl-prolyl cis-trans isomerase [Desulfarculaceae bacterium]